MLTEDQKKIIAQLSQFEQYISKLNVLFKEKLAELEKHHASRATVAREASKLVDEPSLSLKPQDSLTN